MSYHHMDHAGWVERNIAAAKQMHKSERPKRDKEGTVVGWHAAPTILTPFQRRAFDILGIVGDGIYNAPITWETLDWKCGGGISLTWGHSMSTFDYSNLTRLVFLCHEARIRCCIRPAGQYLRILLHPRKHDGDSMSRHPNLEEAIANFRKQLGDNHPILYRPTAEPTPNANAVRTGDAA